MLAVNLQENPELQSFTECVSSLSGGKTITFIMLEIKEDDLELQQILRKVTTLVAQAKTASSHSQRDPVCSPCCPSMPSRICGDVILGLDHRNMRTRHEAVQKYHIKNRD